MYGIRNTRNQFGSELRTEYGIRATCAFRIMSELGTRTTQKSGIRYGIRLRIGIMAGIRLLSLQGTSSCALKKGEIILNWYSLETYALALQQPPYQMEFVHLVAS